MKSNIFFSDNENIGGQKSATLGYKQKETFDLITGAPKVTLVSTQIGRRGGKIPAESLVQVQQQYEELKAQELEKFRERDPNYNANKQKFFGEY